MTTQKPPAENLSDDGFIGRHIGTTGEERAEMLAALGEKDLDGLVKKIVPADIYAPGLPGLGEPLDETGALKKLREIAGKNKVFRSLIGQGYYGTITPAVIGRNVLENPAWYTSYTPYQAEIAQGRLEALFHFQTVVCELTGMEVANASLLDEATAAAEAMSLCRRVNRVDSDAFLVSKDSFPQTIAVLRTRARYMDIDLRVVDPGEIGGQKCFGALVQYPGNSGEVRDFGQTVEKLHEGGALAVMATDLLALLLLSPPAAMGADVAVGSSQRFGVPLGGGGPHAGFIATREKFARNLPGRVIGRSVDRRGRPAYRMALQTREQHIRREKATSNICTAQALLAVIAALYAVYHGPRGLRAIAGRVHKRARVLAAGLEELGFAQAHSRFFDTLRVATGARTAEILVRAQEHGVNLRKMDRTHIGLSLDEATTEEEVALLWRIFSGDGTPDFRKMEARAEKREGLPEPLLRRDRVLPQKVFSRHRSETEMLRYIRSLSDKDIALDRAMIPLGSCTMKLNATSEMLPVTWPEFADIHPFAPAEQRAGYEQLRADLERQLCAVTGYAAVSLQPNAGSQGEYAGLCAIRAWQESRGQGHRDVCLIPSSAHGTNPATAYMCGLRVVVVGCDKHGNVDLRDLRAKAEEHGERLAAVMITYPSTHGVFEPKVRELCEIVHRHGGQVYIDGANLNATVGLCAPGEFGGDVSHLNLHKTFCIPHGGGGPGVGPVAVAGHLRDFLPGGGGGVGAVAAAPLGSAGILPITWMYLEMTGAPGQKQITEAAILHANYIARRLGGHYPVLYKGKGGFVAHECIIDLRGFKKTAGVLAEDVAKRLIDYGFHAPTMSFPVENTLMVEPTESESKREMDRFCDAMVAIRGEIAAIEEGRCDRRDNPLKNAPHTEADILDADWPHPYSREAAACPRAGRGKYWPPVNRVDNVHGDRNLVCRGAKDE